MDSTLAEFSATLAIGAFFLLGIALVLELCWPNVILRYVKSDHIPNSVVVSFVAAIALTAGLLLENLSNLVVDTYGPILSPIPNEKTLRASVLLSDPMRSQYKRNPDALKLLDRAHVSKTTLSLLQQQHAPEVTIDTDVNEIYYTAKNMVFMHDNYYDELRSHQSRIDFSRSFTMCCLLHCACAWVCLLALIKPRSEFARVQIIRRLACAFVFFFVLYWIGRYAYTAEEREFNKRTFGYFLIVAVTDDNTHNK